MLFVGVSKGGGGRERLLWNGAKRQLINTEVEISEIVAHFLLIGLFCVQLSKSCCPPPPPSPATFLLGFETLLVSLSGDFHGKLIIPSVNCFTQLES